MNLKFYHYLKNIDAIFSWNGLKLDFKIKQHQVNTGGYETIMCTILMYTLLNNWLMSLKYISQWTINHKKATACLECPPDKSFNVYM